MAAGPPACRAATLRLADRAGACVAGGAAAGGSACRHASCVMGRCARDENSTHCSSSTPLRCRRRVTWSRSAVNAAIIAVSHSVLIRRGTPPV